MRFQKNVPEEHKAFLMEQMKQYKKEMDLTKEELKDLEDWVSRGRSPYDNGDYICTEGGYPMDFISAQRFLNEESEWHNSHQEETREPVRTQSAYDTADDCVAFTVTESDSGLFEETELPFS